MAYPEDVDVRVIITKDDVHFAVSSLFAFNTLYAGRGYHVAGYLPGPDDEEGTFIPSFALWRGGWVAGATYSMNQIVSYPVEGFSINWIARNGPLTNARPDLHPESWDIYGVSPAAETVLSIGEVADAGGVQNATTNETFLDTPGCTTAPGYSGPMTARIRGPLGLGTASGTVTLFLQARVIDDLGIEHGRGITKYIAMTSSTGLYVALTPDIKIPAQSPLRTYRLQISLHGSNVAFLTWGGTIPGGAGNKTRLEMVPR